jgi:hypothetical protein
MTPHISSKTWEKIEDLREEIEELQRQKDKLQELYDFADFIETHNLIDREIEVLQKQLLQEKKRLAENGETFFETDIKETEGVEEDE